MLPEEAPARAHHDMGGVSRFACEPVDKSHREMTAFDRQVDALRQVLGATGLFSTDEMRRGIEGLPPDVYDRSSYYQRWLFSMVTVMLEKGVITEAELRSELAA
ncbi:SH3-like domain-containing protein [Teichococcus vastitatis]|uniref:SH3-like domain-containing protein n=1 Tax=Teichococcus vastitatis TaxID=2307076 RepID=UPI0024104CD8|nr:SH3-like domain-containing protein [Pseudoroseomonas vastitatis]